MSSVAIIKSGEAAATGVAFLCRRGAGLAASGVATAFVRVLFVTGSLVFLGIIEVDFLGTNLTYRWLILNEFH